MSNNVNVRKVDIDLTAAKHMYASGEQTLKEIALSCFSKKELHMEPYELLRSWNDIKTYYLQKYNIDLEKRHSDLNNDSEYRLVVESEHILKMHYILKALNDRHKSLYNEYVWYPTMQLYRDRESAQHVANTCINKCLVGKVNIFSYGFGDPKDFWIVTGVNFNDTTLLKDGEASSDYVLDANIGMFACKSKDIAIHLGKYFYKEIFNLVYGRYKGYSIIPIKDCDE
jgi:hypothetical protein